MDFRRHVRAHLPPVLVSREPEIVTEIAEHLSDLYEEARADGLSHDAAVARASSALPAYAAEFARELERSADTLPQRAAHRWQSAVDEPPPRGNGRFIMLMDLRSDLRYALRSLIKTPGLTLGIVLTLAVGIGANAAIFSAIDALLLRPPRVGEPEMLVDVYSATADGRARFGTSSNPNYADLKDAPVFDGLAAYGSISLALDLNDTTVPLSGQVVTGNYFDVLRVRLAHGRGFLPGEDRAGSPAYVAVISHGAWQKYFGGDASAVERTVSLNGKPFTVIGIAPPGFTGPVLGQNPEVWVPMALQPEVRPPSAGLRRSLGSNNLLNRRDIGWLSMVGRLRSGTTPDAALGSVDVIAKRLEAAYPDTNRGRWFDVVPLGEGPGVRAAARPLLRVLGVAVVLVLLIACANVAGLLIVRALARQKEIGVRLAIGASRSRLVRQWLAESLLLALAGAGVGVLLAWWTTPLLHGVGIPETVDISIDRRVLAFTLTVAVASALIFGCASVVQFLGRDSLAALREGARGTTTSRRAARWRSAFVVTQVALSLILLSGASLFLRTLQNAYAVDLGYGVDRTLLTDLNLDTRAYSPESGQRTYAEVLDRIGSIPGVEALGAARVVMLSGSERRTGVSTDGRPLARDGSNGIGVRTNVVSHGYLEALRIPVLRGRDFGPEDHAGSTRVAIVSRSLANRLWPNADPIGRPLITAGPPFVVIGVVPDVVYESPIETESPPFFYSLLAQNYEGAVTLYVRTVADPAEMFPVIRQVVREIDPLLVLTTPVSLRQVLDRSLGDQRMMARLVSLFGVAAVALAMIGLYGVLAHQVVQRRAEIGVRLALGARPESIVALVLRQGLRLVLLGLPLGLAGALAASRYVRSQLFGVEPTDPLTYATVTALFLVITAVACLIPARRAVRVDPAIALRQA
jgi:predicted permease